MTIDDADQSGILAKIRALLAKAESTTFEAEAEALTAKAQELMTRHSIDEAVARASGRGSREVPGGRRVVIEQPYAKPKTMLLSVCARHNGVSAISDGTYTTTTLVGFPSDVEAVVLLYTSLVVQASRALISKGTVRDARGRPRTRSFRTSFYLAFAQRISERLKEAAAAAEQEAVAEIGECVLPMLASRHDEVEAVTARLFPRVTTMRRSSITNPEGWVAGRLAADAATLGPGRERLSAG